MRVRQAAPQALSKAANMTEQRDAAAVRVFPPAVPALTILLGIALQRVWPIQVDQGMDPATRYWVGGLIVAGAFFGLGLWSVILFRQSGQNENPWKPGCSDPRKRLDSAAHTARGMGAAALGNTPRRGLFGAKVRGHLSGLQGTRPAMALE
jgi:hypothetical protein